MGSERKQTLIPKAQIQRGECIYQLSVYFLYMPLHISSAQTRRNPGDLFVQENADSDKDFKHVLHPQDVSRLISIQQSFYATT